MFVDMISYELAEGVSEESLKEAALNILEIWMKKQKGFLAWDICKMDSGYKDFVFLENKECADLAAQKMGEIPSDHKWLKCYDMATIKSEKLETLFSYRN